MVSILMDASGKHNGKFQTLLDEWERVKTCGTIKSKTRRLRSDVSHQTIMGKATNSTGSMERKLAKKVFDIYHPDLMPSIYFHAYKGTLTVPPCIANIHWRVMDRPMIISRAQLNQMKELLINGPCKGDPMTKGLGNCLARPTQESNERPYWVCNKKDFLSDCERFGRNCD